MSSRVETQQSVLDGHLVKCRSFLVAEERVRDPDFSPAVVSETKLSQFTVEWSEDKSRVPPFLTQIHADGVVLQYSRPALAVH